jgi:site-specific DNA-cytosine methylase
MSERVYTVACPFGGIGGGALGFLQAEARLFETRARFRCVGNIDVDPLACAGFEALTGSPSLQADIATMTPAELRAFIGDAAPDVVFASPPCKGMSSLLSTKQAKTTKYRKLNRLVLDWVRLMLEAWPTPPRLFLLENVPRIAGPRGRRLLQAAKALLRRAGYVFHAGTHDCGELGGLAQRRTRFLLVARYPGRCAPLLYQPPKLRVRGCGEVLEKLPLPGDGGGPMHELPRLSWLNWVRLALIPAGGDWRDLEGVLVDGQPRREVFRRHHVSRWSEPTATVAGSGSNGPSAVADPRLGELSLFPTTIVVEKQEAMGASGQKSEPASAREGWNRGAMGVLDWAEVSGTVTGNGRPSAGRFAVADPRFGHVDRVTSWDAPVGTVTHSPAPSSGGGAVADPRIIPQAGNAGMHEGKYRVSDWLEPTGAVIGATRIGSGAPSVADPRVKIAFDHGYAVLRWDEPSSTIAGGSHPGQGAYSVADPRGVPTMTVDEARALLESAPFDVRKPPPFQARIIAADGTWHRPLTTLELAALQGFPTTFTDGSPLVFGVKNGKLCQSHARELIGNAVPPPAAKAIAERMLVALLQHDLEAFALSGGGAIWVDRAEAARC